MTFYIDLYDESGLPLSIGIYSWRIAPSSLEVRAQVFAVAPPDDPEIVREVFRGRVEGLVLRLEARGVLREVAEKWVEFEKKRGPVTRDSETSVRLCLWVIDRASGEVLQRMCRYYTYSPLGLLEGEERSYSVKVVVPRKALQEAGAGLQGARAEPLDGCPCHAGDVFWVLKYKVVPENYTQAYGEHIIYASGAWYVRTPLLAVYNQLAGSGSMSGSISIDIKYETWFYASVGIGFEIEEKLKAGDVTGGLNYKVHISPSRKDKMYFYEELPVLGPWEEAYVWIWARPVMLFYDEYRLTCTCEAYRTGYQDIEFFIQDVVKTYDSYLKVYKIEGGMTKGPIPDFIRKWIFNETLTEYRYVGPLSPDEGVTLGAIIGSSIDVCEADFEIPVSALLSTVLSLIPQTAPFAPLATLISVSISYGKSTTVYVGGGLMNHGPYTEYLYLRASKLYYAAGPCYYKVPVSMYFESK
ncbi:MAG: hypothetical protein ACP5KA_06695 [Desulfurococcaceae archaeon]